MRISQDGNARNILLAQNIRTVIQQGATDAFALMRWMYAKGAETDDFFFAVVFIDEPGPGVHYHTHNFPI